MTFLEVYESLQQILDKLQRNELQLGKQLANAQYPNETLEMEDIQKLGRHLLKTKYAKGYQKYKTEAVRLAHELLINHYFPSNMRILEEDKNQLEEILQKYSLVIKEEEEKGSFEFAYSKLFDSYNIDDLLEFISPVTLRIEYEVYGPYWLTKCKYYKSQKTYHWYNELFSMWYDEDCKIWIDIQTGQVSILYPPTRLAFKEWAMKELQDLNTMKAKEELTA